MATCVKRLFSTYTPQKISPAIGGDGGEITTEQSNDQSVDQEQNVDPTSVADQDVDVNITDSTEMTKMKKQRSK
jgi:hypothetical protein